MKKIVLMIVLIISINVIIASEIDDLRFIIGLYGDENYQLAEIEIHKFLRNYPKSSFKSDAEFLNGNIKLRVKDFVSAESIFKKLYERDDNISIKAETMIGLATSLFHNKKFKDSEKILWSFNSIFGKHKLRWKSDYYLGLNAHQIGNYQKAISYFDDSLTDKKRNQVLLAQIKSQLALNQIDEVEKNIERIDSKDDSQYLEKALILYYNYNIKNNNYNKVLSYLTTSISSKSIYYNDYLLLKGIAHFELGDYNSSLVDLNSIKKENELKEYYLSLILMKTGELDKAEADLKRLSQNAQNDEIGTNSYFFYLQIRSKTSPERVNENLKTFIKDNPNHQFLGVAWYQMGVNYFNLKNYLQAKISFEKAVLLDLDSETKDKALYLLSESLFLLNEMEKAEAGFQEYFEKYKDGKFIDEAIFKIALLKFQKEDYIESLAKFQLLINNYPNSHKTGMSNFYLGEIFFFKNQNEIAEEKYKEALKGDSDFGYIYERLAEINYQKTHYLEALEQINLIPDEAKYLFKKYLLKGDILFASKKYKEATRAYLFAENHTTDSQQKQEVLNKQAWTYYQRKQYSKATKIYEKLSQGGASPEKFIILAATTSFSAENYKSAIENFKKYLKDYPKGSSNIQAIIGIADSYYNLGNYFQASKYYRKLLTPETDLEMMENALNGLEWSSSLDKRIDFITLLNDILEKNNDKSFQGILLHRLMKFQFENDKFSETIIIGQRIEKINYKFIDDVKMLMAESMTNLKKYDEAERIFQELSKKRKSAILFYNWAEMKLSSGDKKGAFDKLSKATKISKDEKIWLLLLNIGSQLNDETFLTQYRKFKKFAEPEAQEEADLIWIEWNVNNEKFEVSEVVIGTLLESKYELIKAKAQYWKGFILYKQHRYSKAIPELLRVRYVFPEMNEIKIRAEFVACKSYLAIDDFDKAKKIFDSIKSELNDEQRIQISNELNVEEN